MDLSASSKTNLLDPLTRIETVFDLAGTPVIFTILPSDVGISSTTWAVPNLSAVKDSMLAIGMHPNVYDHQHGMNDIPWKRIRFRLFRYP